MAQSLSEIFDRMTQLEEQLDEAFKERAQHLRYELKNRRVVFEREVLDAHRAFRIHLAHYVLNARFLSIATAPIIYAMVVPLAFLDLSMSIYQAICFTAYGVPKVRRGDYIIFDRHKLAYLNALQKFNCVYCSYGNGMIAYVQEIASRTEAYWCPIKHAQSTKSFMPRYARFSDYGSAETYHEDFERNREEARKGL
jgi:hypothetical protein